MKTLGYKRSIGLLGGAFIAAFVLMSACQGQNQTAATPPPYLGPTPCLQQQLCPPGCVVGQVCQQGLINGAPLATAVGSLDNYGSYLALTFVPLNQNQVPVPNGGPMPPYSGPVTASGEIFIAQPPYGCSPITPSGIPNGIPAGHFPIANSGQQGMWSMGSISGLVLQASNGMTVKLFNAYISYDNSNPQPRLKALVSIPVPMGPDCRFVTQ